MEISRERRREIIAALRKGTVPQRGLDFLAVGLRPFEPVIASELGDVAARRGRLQGRSWRLWVRQDLLWSLGPGVRQEERASPSPRYRSPRRKRRSTAWRLFTGERWSSFPLTDCFLGAFRSIIDGWFYGLEEDVLAEGNDRSLRREGAGRTGRCTAGTTACRDHSCDPAIRRRSACLSGGSTSETTMPPAEGLAGWLAGQPHVAASVKGWPGIKGDVDHFAALSFLAGPAPDSEGLWLFGAGAGSR